MLKDSITKKVLRGYTPENNECNRTLKVKSISNSSPSISFIEKVQHVIAKKLLQLILKRQILTLWQSKAQATKSSVWLKLWGAKRKRNNEIKIAIGGGFGYL
jgi:ABC-2 type transport system permease protein